jgi:large subunit ribosomal protein L31
MKTSIHPTWYPEASVKCACGTTYTMGAAVPLIQVEVCAACHPFYTGQMKFVDTAGRVDAFKARQTGAANKVLSKADRRRAKKEKRIKEEFDRPESLEDIRKLAKAASKKAKKSSKSPSGKRNGS